MRSFTGLIFCTRRSINVSTLRLANTKTPHRSRLLGDVRIGFRKYGTLSCHVSIATTAVMQKHGDSREHRRFPLLSFLLILAGGGFGLGMSSCDKDHELGADEFELDDQVRSTSAAEMFHLELEKALEVGQIDRDLIERQERAKPWNSYHSSTTMPQCIVFPESTEDVSKILKVFSIFHSQIYFFCNPISY